MQWIDLQRVLEGFDSLRKLLSLHVNRTQEIPGISVVRVDLSHVMKRIDRGLSIARVLRVQAEVIPRLRIPGILLERVLQRSLGFVDLLQVQEGDALIQSRDRELRIELGGLLERLP